MTVLEYLEFFAATYRINGPARRKVCEEKLELVDILQARAAMVSQLSAVDRELAWARHAARPQVLLLTNRPAVDTLARIEIRNLLKRLGAE
ncbi:MAG: hypothetical protein R3C12_13190 [Planctomycetaceae bacterium]